MLRTSNPALSTFEKPHDWDQLSGVETAPKAMTVQGTAVATLILLAICAAVGVLTFNQVATQAWPLMPIVIGSSIASLVFGMIIAFTPRAAPLTTPLFAGVEGVLVGSFSYMIPKMFDLPNQTFGLIAQSVFLTFGVLGALALAYSLGMIRLGSVAKKVIVFATAGIAVFYIASFVLRLFGMGDGVHSIIWSDSPLSIGLSVVIVIVASLNLVLDFQHIENGVRRGAPKYMEWYGAFGLLVTVVWLYIEILKLLAKLQSRE